MQTFHTASWPERAVLDETFDDHRLRELGRTILFFGNPNALSADLREKLEARQVIHLHSLEGIQAGRTIRVALDDLDRIDVDSTNAAAVDEIRSWLNELSDLPENQSS